MAQPPTWLSVLDSNFQEGIRAYSRTERCRSASLTEPLPAKTCHSQRRGFRVTLKHVVSVVVTQHRDSIGPTHHSGRGRVGFEIDGNQGGRSWTPKHLSLGRTLPLTRMFGGFRKSDDQEPISERRASTAATNKVPISK